MAKEDLDNMQTGKRQAAAPVEATDNLVGFGESINDIENRAAAEAAGVRDPAHIDYDVALEAYEARNDVESLARKNARNNPETFADAAFMRSNTEGYVGSGSGN